MTYARICARLAIATALSCLSACQAPHRSPPLSAQWSPPASPEPLARPIAPLDERSLAWGRDEAFLLIADKDCYTLDLYRYGRFVRSYPVVFGRRPGQKLHEGDRRTPTGLYMIIGKRHHARWSRFLLLDYPTDSDRSRYRRQVAAGWVPKRGTTDVGVGGEIGIHGTDSEALNRAKVNWTFGCISMFNTDVRELYATVPTGTLVYISD